MDFSTNDLETFLSLSDTKAEFTPDLEKLRAEREPVEEVVADESDFDDNVESFDLDRVANEDGSVLTFEDEDGWEDTQEDEESEDEATDEVEEVDADNEVANDDEEVEYEEGEAYDVDYDTIITLPDGRDLSIEDLATGYLAGSELTEREAQIQTHIAQFEERVAGMKDVLELASLEADRVIGDYDGFDWEALAKEDPQAYVENSRFLERYKQRKNELLAAQQRLKAEADQKEQQVYVAQCNECVQILKKEIPNWDEPLYQSLMQYAVDLGTSEEQILKENRPSIFLALYKAYQFDKGRQQVIAKIKKPGAPKRVVKSNGKATPVTSEKQNSAAVAKAFKEGRVSHADAFKHLVD